MENRNKLEREEDEFGDEEELAAGKKYRSSGKKKVSGQLEQGQMTT